MKVKRLISILIASILLMLTFSSGLYSYALVTCETQFSYDSADPSWLKDLIVKEDMNTVNGLSGRNTLKAVAEYPYRATADSFASDIAYYQLLYTLDEDMANAAYLYILDVATTFGNSTIASGQSDEYIQAYLESLGVVYPSGAAADDAETRIVARALYAVISVDDSYTIKRGTGLYDAFTAYLSRIIGVDNAILGKFDGDNDMADLKEYVLAACKYSLYAAGYNVDKDTSEEEVYRLIAVMTIRAQGISIDSSSATFEEIKNKYLCAMMCKIYDVSIDTDAFEKAVKNGNLACYMLQLIGKKYKITVKDSATLNEAFDIVCKNTPYFDLEEGEFYADIHEYDIQLKYIRDTVWIYPQTLSVTSESDGIYVTVSVNGNQVRENYYVDVSLDASVEKSTVLVTVDVKNTSGRTDSSTYKLNFIQGNAKPVSGSTISSALAGIGSLAQKVVEDMGSNSVISDFVAKIPFETPEKFWSIASLMLPNFISGAIPGSGLLQRIFSYSKNDDSRVETDKIGGVAGLDSFNASSDSSQSMNFASISLSPGDLSPAIGNPAESADKPASEIIVGDNNGNLVMNTPVQNNNGNWFTELMGDTKSVIVIVVALIAAFAACLFLFTKLLNGKEAVGGRTMRTNKKK